jgi:hypothetical protein
MKCAWLNTPLCIPYKHFLYTAYNKSAIFDVRNLTRCQMNLLPPSSVWTCHRSLQIWNFNIILTYKNVEQCSISFVVRNNKESWHPHNCKLEWIKCFKEVTKNKILKAILGDHIQLRTMKTNCSNSWEVLHSLTYTSVVTITGSSSES